jgi:predicted phosphodiesterase
MRIFAISDLHTDIRENWEFIHRLSYEAFQRDTLIVAGDIADNLEIIGRTLGLLRTKFGRVCYVPGNHELWTRGPSGDAVQKLHQAQYLCRRLDIDTQPLKAGGCWIIPLFSWYDLDSIAAAIAEHPELEGWADFYWCRWPQSVGPSVAAFFLQMNEPHIKAYDLPVITFSHFVPRRDLLPDPDFLRFKGLYKVAICHELDKQIRRLGASAHVFGHTHIACDRVIDGVRYVQNHLRYPKERQASPFPFKMVWPPQHDSSPSASHDVEESAGLS